MLLVGRILGGISTSLLFSVFDSWLVSESQRHGFSGEQLGSTFSLAYFGSSVAAIAAGQLGEVAANLLPLTEVGGGFYYGGYMWGATEVRLCLPRGRPISSLSLSLSLALSLSLFPFRPSLRPVGWRRCA
ncbi:unnamed protein product [Prorocentrum cordatum]|uniref:Major facilitator superfamily (MFS) profile domain-containing protein n=1 Tax=Prorocentrum cordatum TaxID=2364126 RepID=A0ABN9Y5M4_9DINO|nr:unnamed protein product [Polarella glacialis]